MLEDELSLDDRREIDAICDSFESAWSERQPPRIESFLCFYGVKRELLLHELIQIDRHYRTVNGEPARMQDYFERFPEVRRQLNRSSEPLARHVHKPASVPAWTLVFVGGDGDSSPRHLHGAGSTIVGRRPVAGVCLPDDSKVSIDHARMEWSPTWCRVIDLGSKNGTFVNETRVTEAWLRVGDILRIGRTCFRIERVC